MSAPISRRPTDYESAVFSTHRQTLVLDKDPKNRITCGSLKIGTLGTLNNQLIVSFKPAHDTDAKQQEHCQWFFQREWEVLKACQQLNVAGILFPIHYISYIGASNRTKLRMIFPYYQGRDLVQFVNQWNHGALKVSNKNIASVQEQLLQIGAELEDKKIIHRDIKMENILWRQKDDGTFEIILCDPSFLRFPRDPTKIICCGSPQDMAPEYAAYHCNPNKTDAQLAEATTHKIDAWNIGLTLLVFINGKLLNSWRSTTDDQAFLRNAKWHQDNDIPDLPKPPNEQSMEHIIWRLLRPRPEERDSASTALAKFQALHRPLPEESQ